MIQMQDITTAKNNITRLFVDQCKEGHQTRELPDGLIACGQFIGPDAGQIPQRGLHGTAAALRVLAASSGEEATSLVQGLVAYLEVCFGCRDAPEGKEDLCRDPDVYNVIKISEALHALSFVKGAAAQTERLRNELVSRLLGSKIDDKGWGYWTRDVGLEPQLLPTAYAIRGLAVHGYTSEIVRPVRAVCERLSRPSAQSESSDPMVRTLALFVMSSDDVTKPADLQVNLRTAFESLWVRLGPLMTENIEQNIEYLAPQEFPAARDRRNEYVRVPWQLYLIALASDLAPTTFAGWAVQRSLSGILGAVNGPGRGFRYPHSNDRISSRTNAILFDVLSRIEPHLHNNLGFRIINWWDSLWTKVSRILNHRVVRWCAVAAAVWAFSAWWAGPNRSWGDFAPDLIASVLLFLMANRRVK